MTMHGRRAVLARLAFAAAAAVLGGRTASSSVAETPRARVARILASLPRSAALSRRANCSFVADARASLKDDIAAGRVEAGTQRIVDCPLRREQIVVSGDSSV